MTPKPLLNENLPPLSLSKTRVPGPFGNAEEGKSAVERDLCVDSSKAAMLSANLARTRRALAGAAGGLVL